ncbi:carbohydrate-binding module family 50 protein [Zasmidium cellare ATCC 36951]|uniref:Carbohydrate-binding module family 50 protein n=1 Tax=Zasmidium cellare ATCC 36951 TaxID=1080233 RepID=A0A6A6CZ29_ZASCE|nr:carbohydrate-binding module family 50 protein [Zasmidium cellare ATCC 36951]KAF2171142.1 carbohydrate-binding module family 50 protein [Zasmidium cellare ATCC 36951]
MSRGRYEALDSDAERLPSGLERVGYDADTQTYSYRDGDGNYWEGEEGNRYGNIHPAGQRPPPSTPISPKARYDDWRYLAPWFVLVVVVLLVLWRFVTSTPAPLSCAEGLENYVVAKGDTCWNIADDRGWTVDGLKEVNDGLNCDKLMPGDQLCVHVA